MNRDVTAENGLTCPNCKALNAPGTIVCSGCGINLLAFSRAQERLQDRLVEQTTSHAQTLEKESVDALAAEVARGKRQTIQLVKSASIVIAVLALLVTATAALRVYRKHKQQEQLAAMYTEALTCLEQGEYICARDGFEAIIRTDESYQDAKRRLIEARHGLARAYAAAGRWERALDELDAWLGDSPDDPRALDLMDDVYDRWLDEAASRWDVLTILKIRARRAIHNP